MRVTSARIVALIGSVVLLGTSASPSLGAGRESVDKIIVSSDEALDDDIAATLRAFPEMTEADARQDYETTLALDGLNTRLQTSHPGIFSHIEIVSGDTKPDAIIHLSGPATPTLVEIVRTVPADVILSVDGKLSATQVERVTPILSDAIKTISGIGQFMGGYDVSQNIFEFRYSPTGISSPGVISQQASVLTKTVLTGLAFPQVPVKLIPDSDAANTAELVSGGTSAGAADGPYDGRQVCTFAFTGTDRAGRRGALSARHCLGGAGISWSKLTYENRFDMTPGNIATNLLGDAQFHYSADAISSAFI